MLTLVLSNVSPIESRLKLLNIFPTGSQRTQETHIQPAHRRVDPQSNCSSSGQFQTGYENDSQSIGCMYH